MTEYQAPQPHVGPQSAPHLPWRRLGQSSARVSELGFGGAGVGNLYAALDETEAREAIREAWNLGIRWFDTAPHYGLGLSERRLGAELAGRCRSELVVSSKVGRLLVPQSPRGRDTEGFDVPADQRRVRDYSRDGVLRSIDDTLSRSGLDRLDLVLIHDPDDHWQEASTQAVPTLARLREEGVVGAVGVGINQSALAARFLRETDVDFAMIAGRYTLLEQGALDDALPAATETGRSIVAVGVFNSGLLATQEVPDDARYNYAPAPPDVLRRAREIAAICKEHGTTLPAAAVAFPLRHPAVAAIAVGMRTAREVRRNVELYSAGVPHELWDALIDARLVRPQHDLPGKERFHAGI